MPRESILKLLFIVLGDGLKAVLYFPLWWYGKGFIKAIKGSWGFIKDFNLTLGFTIWLKNLFVPMFGQRDIAGRLISFFLRLFNIIFRGVFLLIFIILNIAFIILWLLLPLIIIYQIFNHLINV